MSHPSRLESQAAPDRRELLRRARWAAMVAAGGSLAPAFRGLDGQRSPVAMRTPAKRHRYAAATTKAVPAPPAAAVIALNRMAFGPRPGDLEAFNTLGATDAERLEAHVEQQLDPATIDDSAFEARLAQSGFTTLEKSLAQLWQDHVASDPPWEIHMQPFYETELATFLRAIHSRRQLVEVLADFWHNHFNVYAYDFLVGAVWVHSDRDAIRAHVLGNFRQMLETVVQSPAMLWYLDNFVNSVDGPNENYARELIELQTLGAAAYLGSIPQSQVPLDGEGRPIGYVDEDVTAAARCLTGWTFDFWEFGNTGVFLYHDPWHDHDAKTVLGTDLPANQPPMQDGQDLLDLLAQHPATGRHIATKLCRRLIGDAPPQEVVDAAAAVFTDQVDAPDQLEQVVRTILLHDAFLATWGDKIKRPFEIAMGAMRGMQGDLPFALGDEATDYFLWMYYQTGQALFAWHPPNGYPDVKAAWQSSSPRVNCWRLANMLIQVTDPGDNFYVDVLGQTPAGVRTANDLADFWIDRILGRPMPSAERDEIVDLMAQGVNPNFELPLDADQDTQDRLRAMVAVLCMSPSFLWR